MSQNRHDTDSRPLEISLLAAGRDSAIATWIRHGLEGLPHRTVYMDALPEDGAHGYDGVTDGESGGVFDPDLALVDEEVTPEFPARLRALKDRFPRCQILLLSQENSDLSPRKLHPVAIRHWFFRPIESEDIARVLRAAGRSIQRQFRDEHRHTRQLLGFEGLIGEHPALLQALEVAHKVAQSTNTSVLILGDTGTGKGMLAQAIHAESPRNNGPYMEINCGAIPQGLMESELFGHVKGAFTTAHRDKPGLLELADGGTAFLDEIGELEMLLQAKLLKFLDDGRIRRVQGTETMSVDVRVVAATNRNLEKEVDDRRFRLDLFHRLNVVSISLPRLQERTDDIPLLAKHYLEKLSTKIRGRQLEWSEDALDALRRYPWPGNVRELINFTERMTLVQHDSDVIELEDLPPEMLAARPVLAAHENTGAPLVELPPDGVSLKEVERSLVEAALARTAGNVTEAARLLHMSRGSLRYRLEKMGLQQRASRRRGRPMRRRRAA